MHRLDDIHKEIAKKRVYLFGAGKIGKEFYLKQKEKLNIVGFFDNDPNAVMDDLPILKPVFRTELDKAAYIIVCSVHEDEMSKQLIDAGYIPFEDFTSMYLYKAFENFLPERKVAFFYGTCHTNAVMNVLLNTLEFTDIYNGICIRVNSKKILDMKATEMIFELADLVVFENYFGSMAQKKRHLFRNSISIPTVFFEAEWPQADIKKEYDLFCKMAGKYQKEYKDTLLANQDIFVNRLIIDGKSEDEIMDLLMSPKFISKEQILTNIKKNFSIIKVAEKSVDIKILDFLKDNYKSIRVYKNYAQLGECLTREYARRILCLLGIDNFQLVSDSIILYPTTDVPIYPCVADCLELEMINKNTRYNILKSAVKEGEALLYSLTFEEYMHEYIRRVTDLHIRMGNLRKCES